MAALNAMQEAQKQELQKKIQQKVNSVIYVQFSSISY